MQKYNILNNKHFFLTSSPDVETIIQPLRQFFGLTSFVYQKNLFDGSEIRLSNQPEWINFFYEQKLYKKSVFEHAPEQYQKNRFLWASLPQHQPVLSKAREFNIDHGITFVEPQKDGCEFFFIGAKREQPEVVSRIVNNLDLLENFLGYFKQKAAGMIKKAEQHRILIPDKVISRPLPFIQEGLNRDEFLAVMNNSNRLQFSPRELQCVRLLTSGYNMKMIAYELQLSYRTIETHFGNIKRKAGCHTKAELVRFLGSF